VIAIGRNPDQIKKTKKLLENHETTIQGNAADSTTAQEGIKLAVDKIWSPTRIISCCRREWAP